MTREARETSLPAANDRRFVEEAFFDPRDMLQVKYEMVRAVRAE